LIVTISCDPIFTGPGRVERSNRTVPSNAFINVQKRARLLAIAPHFDCLAAPRHGNFAANRRGGLFAAAGPCPFWPEDVVIASDMRLQPVIPAIGRIEPLAK
jgi:hypothetical protein